MNHKTVLITGSTDGVGRVVAERLGQLGMRVLVHGRDGERGMAVVQAIRDAGGDADFLAADLSSLSGVRRLAEAVAATAPKLDLMINNAGIGAGRDRRRREESADGNELRLAVNYLAPFLLTRLLLPQIRAAAPSRIVNVASIGQQEIDFNDIQFHKGYGGLDAYRRAKLALIMFTFDLAEELGSADVTVTALHPATLMGTTMVIEAGATPMSTIAEGADAIMNLAVGPATEGVTGKYYDELKPAAALGQAYDAEARHQLRDLAYALTGAPRPA